MCFSASASFVAGAALSGAGSVTVQKATKKQRWYAAIPFLFGVQQLSEGALWLAINHDLPHLQTAMTYVFTAFSHVLWPAYVPFAVLSMETDQRRRKIMSVLQAMGLLVALFHLYEMVYYPLTADVINHSIVYHLPRPYLPLVLIGYFAATCGAPLASSHRLVRWFGAAVLSFAAIAYLIYTVSFVSVWCFFAALLSLMIFWFIAGKGK